MVLASSSVSGIEPHRTLLPLSAVPNRVGPLGQGESRSVQPQLWPEVGATCLAWCCVLQMRWGAGLQL